MGIYDYPTEELKQKDLNAYILQKEKAQRYGLKLAEFKGMSEHHAELSKFHKDEAIRYKKLYEDLKKENE